MNLIRFSIENPVKISVAVLLAALFGLLSVFRIPIQLTPDVDRPIITISTRWEGASPAEVESEIIERQEEKLKSVSNLRKMTSESREGRADVELEFFVGVDKDDALRDTIEKINQVSNYPVEVERPEVVASEATASSAIAWLHVVGPEDVDVSTLYDYIYDNVKPMLERVEGLAEVQIYGGREREAQVRIDPRRLAARGLTFRDVEAALRRQNRNISAGTVTQGKREAVFRTRGEFETVEQIAQTVIADTAGGPVYVADVVREPEPDGSRPGIALSYKKQTSFVRANGKYVLAMPARRETGSNVMAVMRGLKEQIRQVNETLFEPQGMGLHLSQTYDETVYIDSAIHLVRNNLVFGSMLAIIVLMLFLRSPAATAVVAASIPISVVTTFLVITVMGRSLNVVMLAGMAFAVGMVVDSAVVVLENTYRHRRMGKGPLEAALSGAREVWGAVLASTLTTVAVFLPVVFIEEEAGRLFRDIAIAIVVAVAMSLIVSVTVIPTLGARLLGRVAPRPTDAQAAADPAKSMEYRHVVARLVRWIIQRPGAKLATIIILATVSILGSWWLVPPSSYLPSGNRNLVFGFLISPPGYSVDEYRRIGRLIEEGPPGQPELGLRRFWEAELDTPAAAQLPPVPMSVGGDDDEEAEVVSVTPPPIENLFYVCWRGGAFMGGTSKDDRRVAPLVEVMSRAGAQIPGMNSYFFQTGLFAEAFEGGGNSVNLEIRGHDLNEVRRAAQVLLPPITERFGFPRPDPVNFAMGRPEVQAIPDRAKAADLGLNVEDIGFTIRACVDGAYVGEFNDRGDKIDLVLIVDGTENVPTSEITSIPVYTPAGKVVPLSSAIQFVTTTGPQQINHIEEQPAVSLTVSVPEQIALQSAMELLEEEIIQPLRAAGQIPSTITTTLAGNADKLVQTRRALFGAWTGFNFKSLLNLAQSRGFLALVVVYLLMCALFESYLYPFVIMFSVPLAALGGFAGLSIMHRWTLGNPSVPTQQLDVLTMLGFIVLIGIVVNNAILLVHQALNFMRDGGMEPDRAIIESVRTRTRPIFMTALTTIFGQLPLVVMSGAGSELYRGLGSVILGGLLVSTVFTLVLVPALFSLMMNLRRAVVDAVRSRHARPAPVARPADAAAGKPEPAGLAAPVEPDGTKLADAPGSS